MITSTGGTIATGAVLITLLAACAGPTTSPASTKPTASAPPATTTGGEPGATLRSDDANVTVAGLPAQQHWSFQPPARYRQSTTTASRTYSFVGGIAHNSEITVTVTAPLTAPNSASTVVTGYGPDITAALLTTARQHLTIAPGAQFGPQPGAAASPAGTQSH